MGRYELEYPKDAGNTIKRHNERATYALKAIHTLINSSPLVHVSFNIPNSEDPYPTTLPMIGQMGSFARPSADVSDPLDLYIHGYVSARMFRTAGAKDPASSSSSSSSTTDSQSPPSLPVCISASHVDGLVLALSSFSHSYNYRSAILFGHATLVTDPEEKLYAMELVTNSVVPGRWDDTRLPLLPAEVQSTSILRVKIDKGSMKVRAAPAGDDKHDMEDKDLKGKHWTGVVPVRMQLGEPVGSSYNKQEVPGYLREFIDETNEEGVKLSEAAAQP